MGGSFSLRKIFVVGAVPHRTPSSNVAVGDVRHVAHCPTHIVCNKFLYNLGAKYSRFCQRLPIGTQKRCFSAIFAINCNTTTYTQHILFTPRRTRQKATEMASFCPKTRVFAPRKWVVCTSQLHELSPKSGASAPQNPYIRTQNYAIGLRKILKRDF